MISRAERLRAAFVCAFSQWALALAIQIGSFYGHLIPRGGEWHADAILIVQIFLIQAQNALVAAIFGIAAYFAVRNRITTWLLFVIYGAESVYLTLDQVYYKIFLDHIRLGAFESGQQFNLAITLDSFTRELDWIFYCSAVVALLGAIWFARALSSRRSVSKGYAFALAFAVLLAGMGVPAWSSKYYGHVNEHALLVMVQELGRKDLVKSLKARGAPRRTIASYRSDQPPDDDARLEALAAPPGAGASPPNVLLIVLESVGAVNLLGPDGLPNRDVTPNLAALARSGIVFNSIYTSFPGTTRSLISLHTGGRQPTFGGIGDVNRRYQGALLPQVMGDLGYNTTYFSSERMDGEGTDLFLRQTGFRSYYDFSQDPHVGDARYQIHSWGAREDYTVGLMKQWLAAQRDGKPFFLEYMTAATHHPYGAPPGYPLPFPAHGRNSDYLNALSYSDRAIGELLIFLQKHGVLRNTVVLVTGDHGESFGDRHANNFLHKNFTYDENIREFVVIFDGRKSASGPVALPVISHRVGSNGDIMPTLLALLGSSAPGVRGRNLLTVHFQPKPVFFHKLSSPETWGLRDGQWKYIGDIRTGTAELYDLSTDALEHRNVAPAHPEKVAEYRDMCQEWFLESERDFTAEQSGYRMIDSALRVGDTRMGARVLSVGFWRTERICAGTVAAGYACQDGTFVPITTANPQAHLLAWTQWSTDPDYVAHYEWVSPSGMRLESRTEPGPGWRITHGAFPATLPMEKGAWSVYLREKSGVHLMTRFSVK